MLVLVQGSCDINWYWYRECVILVLVWGLVLVQGVCDIGGGVRSKVLIVWYANAILYFGALLYLLPSTCNHYILISKYPLQRLLSNGKSFMCWYRDHVTLVLVQGVLLVQRVCDSEYVTLVVVQGVCDVHRYRCWWCPKCSASSTALGQMPKLFSYLTCAPLLVAIFFAFQ